MIVNNLLLHLPKTISTRICKNGTIIEFGKDGRKLYTFGKNTKPYKAGFSQMEVIKMQPSSFLTVCMIKDAQNVMQATKIFSSSKNAVIYGKMSNPFKKIADYIRDYTK